MTRGQTREHLQRAHRQNTLSKAQINRWYSRFEADPQTVLTDLRRSKGPQKLTPAKLDQIRTVVEAERRSTLRQVARQVGLVTQTVHKALRKDLQLCKKPAKWVPHFLNPAQKLHQVVCAHNALALLRRWNRPANVICGDESWFWIWDPESKRASAQWINPG